MKSEEPINKETYVNIVKFTLDSMLSLSKTDPTYDLFADVYFYYNNTILKDKVITEEEFRQLCDMIMEER